MSPKRRWTLHLLSKSTLSTSLPSMMQGSMLTHTYLEISHINVLCENFENNQLLWTFLNLDPLFIQPVQNMSPCQYHYQTKLVLFSQKSKYAKTPCRDNLEVGKWKPRASSWSGSGSTSIWGNNTTTTLYPPSGHAPCIQVRTHALSM